MRSRRRITWVVYGACVALVAAVLTIVSWQALRLERQERLARRETVRQEAVRLALWRMDSRLTPILVREAARPYFHYRSFFPGERPYSRMWEPLTPGETLAPSPLLGFGLESESDPDTGLIRLHFQAEPDGALTSPQAPRDEMLSLAQAGYRTLGQVAQAEGLLNRLDGLLGGGAFVRDSDRALERGKVVLGESVRDDNAYASDAEREFRTRQLISEQAQRNVVTGQSPQLSAHPPASVGAELSETLSDSADEDRSAGRSAASAEGLMRKATPGDAAEPEEQASPGARYESPPLDFALLINDTADSRVQLDSFVASWIDSDSEPELVYIRDVRIEGERYRQGFWVDWDALSALLTDSVRDLLPNARVVPAVGGTNTMNAAPELLASVPVRLVPGDVPVVAQAGLSATRGTLLLSWLALAGAAVAIGFVLRAAIQLSERRGRFVSAVTHELRTPLTTFRLYAQMLADGMVTDEDARREYLATLKSESGRLSGIVENVLEYARLSRRRAGPEQTLEMAPEALLVRLRPMLSRRAEQSGMDLIVSADLEDATRRGITLTIDPQSVERILMNLVENACKYAGPGEGEDDEDIDPRIHLDVRVQGDQLEFLVADYGPGIAPRERARVFGEFQRGAARPMRSGLGLGLALSRGLAREGGGELRLVRRRGHGAEFLLSLPIRAPHGG